MHRSLRASRPLFALLVLAAAAAASCSNEEPPPQIRVRESDLVIQNRTDVAWTNVDVWVNDHFHGAVPAIQPTQQLVVPLDALQAAFGQRFDRSRQTVFGVLVTAKASDGTAVRLTWGRVRRR